MWDETIIQVRKGVNSVVLLANMCIEATEAKLLVIRCQKIYALVLDKIATIEGNSIKFNFLADDIKDLDGVYDFMLLDESDNLITQGKIRFYDSI